MGAEDGSARNGLTDAHMNEQEMTNRKILSIARGMSAPTIELKDSNKVRFSRYSVRLCLFNSLEIPGTLSIVWCNRFRVMVWLWPL